MNFTEMLGEIITPLLHQGKEVLTDAAFETAFDVFISNYRKLCTKMAKRYLDFKGSDEELLARFRDKIVRVMKISTITVEELDDYVVGWYRDVWGGIQELLIPVKRHGRFSGKNVSDADMADEEDDV